MSKQPFLPRRAFVLGWPVAHSRSPLIHRYWLSVHDLDGYYDRLEIQPQEIHSFLEKLPYLEGSDGYIGGNVTIPYKETAFGACRTVTDQARRMGAVNTLWIGDGQLHGDNTDSYGFATNLDHYAPGWDDRAGPALVIGAGGASRAVLVALAERGIDEIRVTNRTADRARQTLEDLGVTATIVPWDQRREATRDIGLLVNTTSLGMAGQPPLDLPLDLVPADAVVNDIVYVPLLTPLLNQARERGLRFVDGLGMLLHQAVPGFERWFGVRPKVDDKLRNILIADLETD